MTTASEEAQSAISELRSFLDRTENLMNEVDDFKKSPSPEKKRELQSSLKQLKNDLKVSAKQPATNKYESAFSKPAITEASVNLTARVNSHPINSDWYSSLYGASMDIGHMLHQLEDYVKSGN